MNGECQPYAHGASSAATVCAGGVDIILVIRPIPERLRVRYELSLTPPPLGVAAMAVVGGRGSGTPRTGTPVPIREAPMLDSQSNIVERDLNPQCGTRIRRRLCLAVSVYP